MTIRLSDSTSRNALARARSPSQAFLELVKTSLAFLAGRCAIQPRQPPLQSSQRFGTSFLSPIVVASYFFDERTVVSLEVSTNGTIASHPRLRRSDLTLKWHLVPNQRREGEKINLKR